MTATVQNAEQKIAKVNRSDMARKLELDRSYISQILSGRRTPSLTTAADIAREVGVSIDALHGWIVKNAGEARAA